MFEGVTCVRTFEVALLWERVIRQQMSQASVDTDCCQNSASKLVQEVVQNLLAKAKSKWTCCVGQILLLCVSSMSSSAVQVQTRVLLAQFSSVLV